MITFRTGPTRSFIRMSEWLVGWVYFMFETEADIGRLDARSDGLTVEEWTA